MSEKSKEGDIQDRRNHADRRKDDRGIRSAPFFKYFLDRRKDADRRGGKDPGK